MAFDADKAAILDLVKAKGCVEAKYIDTNANNYAQLLDMVIEFASTFDCDQDYLNDLLDVIDDTILVSLGVYYNKTDASIDNPVLLVGSTYATVNINAGGDFKTLQIFNTSPITNIIVDNNTNLGSLVVSGGSTVTKLEVREGSCIGVVLVKACATFNSTLDKIVESSCIKEMGIDEDATFNGYTCELISV